MGQYTSLPIQNVDFYNAVERRVNVIEFGADPTGVADSTAAIQAAIDFAFAAQMSDVFLPNGSYKITNTIRLDSPAHNTGAFSMCIHGSPNAGNHEGFGSRLVPTFNDKVALLIGPGQGMEIKDLQIIGPGGAYRGNQPSTGAGIGYEGRGVASRTRTDNVEVLNFYTAFLTGATGDGLNDSNTFIKCLCFNCAVGLWVSQTQNFINSVYDCNFQATIGVLCGNGGSAHIFGGNYSVPSSQNAALACSGISAWTATPLGNSFSYTFTANVTADAFFTGPNGVYNSFVFPTTHFGLVPCTLVSFVAGVATFAPLQTWVEFNFGTFNITTVTDLVAEVQANVKVYCAERVTTFSGVNITVIGVHIENDFSATTLINSDATFGSDRPNVLQQVFFNTDPGFANLSPSHSPSDSSLALYYAAHSFPFIIVQDVTTKLSDSDLGITSDPVIIDGTASFTVERCNNFKANMRICGAPGGGQLSFTTSTQLFDTYYFISYGAMTNEDSYFSDRNARRAPQKSPNWIFRPAAYTTPGFTPTDLATISGALPALGGANKVPYSIPWGGQVYKLNDFTMGAQAKYQFISTHKYWSYGQDLTTTNVPGLSWSYKGQSSAVYLDAGSMLYMKPGLGIILNDGSTDVQYMVTAIYPGLGYITVSTDALFVGLTSGAKTATITGTTIKQEPFSITTF